MKLFTFSYKDVAYIQKLEKEITSKIPTVTFTKLPERANYILAIGGDGTTLSAKELAITYNIPIISINFGTLGFLSSSDDLYTVFDAIMEDTAGLIKRPLVNLIGPSLVNEGKALNDIVISNMERGRLLEIIVIINGERVIYSCDSLIISTPAGSTAYNLSAGGSIINPEVKALALTPVAPFSMSARSIIIPDNWNISIVSNTDLFIKFDGGNDKIISANEAQQVVVEGNVSLVRLNDMFFKSIQDKLKWNIPIKN